MIAPQLLMYEVVNGIATASRRKHLTPEIAFQAVENLVALRIDLREVEPLLLLEVSLRYNLVAYDAAYLALAESERCGLWTGDRAFYQAVKDKSKHVRWIGDYAGKGIR